MHYVAIDLHKRSSVVSALNEQGQRAQEARIDGNSAAGFAQFIHGLGGPSKVVMEATWNWGRIHDLLEKIEGGCSNYFGGIYRHHRARGKGANTAIVIVARRMAEIAWHLLREGRPYRDQPPAQDTLPDRSENALMEVAH